MEVIKELEQERKGKRRVAVCFIKLILKVDATIGSFGREMRMGYVL